MRDSKHTNQGGNDVEKRLTEVFIVASLVIGVLFNVLIFLVAEGVLS